MVPEQPLITVRELGARAIDDVAQAAEGRFGSISQRNAELDFAPMDPASRRRF
jgi:hypothetical protein